MENLEQELVTTGEMSGGGLAVGDLSVLERKIEASLAAYDRLLKMTVKRTLPTDWVDQQGVPYLMSTGAERIARPWGIYVRDVRFERESRTDAKGDYYIWWCTATVGSRLLDAELEFIGSCSSRDKFFGRAGNTLKPIEDVDEPNIKKKSYTNMFINGITRLLGLRRLDYRFLAECGIKKEEMIRVDYGGKGGTDLINDAQAKLLFAKAKAKTDVGASMEIIKGDFKEKFGIDDFKQLPKNRMTAAIAFLDAIKV